MNCLYISHIICKYKIFSHSVGCVFVDGFLCCAKLLSLIRSHLFIFAFIFSTLEDRSKKFFSHDLCQSVLPMYSSRNFVVSHLNT